MRRTKPDRSDWRQAVSEATDHVQDRVVAGKAAAEKQRPKGQGAKILFALLMLLGVLTWDVRQLTIEPEIPEIDERAHLAWFIADGVDLIEDFRFEQGRLPTTAEASAFLEDDMAYDEMDGEFQISIEGDGIVLEYDSEESFQEWMIVHAGVAPGGSE